MGSELILGSGVETLLSPGFTLYDLRDCYNSNKAKLRNWGLNPLHSSSFAADEKLIYNIRIAK